MLTPKLWALLNPARRDASFGTLQSLIGHTVLEILTAGKILEEEEEEYITFLRYRFLPMISVPLNKWILKVKLGERDNNIKGQREKNCLTI